MTLIIEERVKYDQINNFVPRSLSLLKALWPLQACTRLANVPSVEPWALLLPSLAIQAAEGFWMVDVRSSHAGA